MNMLFLANMKSALIAASAVVVLVAANAILFVGAGGSAAVPASSKAEAAALEAPPVVEPGADLTTVSVGEITWNSDLIGHWTLDDQKIADSSGRAASGKAVGTVAWVEGRIGNAAKFDGKDGHVELPNSESLDKVQEGSYTLSAWFKPDDVPPGKDSENNASYAIVVKAGWHLGLSYSGDRKFAMTHWLATDKPEEPEWKGAGTWDDEYAPGSWYHLTGVVDRAAGKVAIYVNGELKNEAEFAANAKARDYGQQPWRVGIAGPGADKWGWSAKGLIDDVRIYSRALAAADIKSLYEGAPKK